MNVYLTILFLRIIESYAYNFTQSEEWPIQQIGIDAVAQNSVMLSWVPPGNNESMLPLFYSIHYAPIEKPEPGEEVDVPINHTSTLIEGLKEETTYSFILSAIFDTSPKLSTPSILVTTQKSSQREIIDDAYPLEPIECNCTSPGMVACVRKASEEGGMVLRCACFPGYQGDLCDQCQATYFWDGFRCYPCPCSNLTSSGDCHLSDPLPIDPEEVTPPQPIVVCNSCLPGHTGPECRECLSGYTWQTNRCVSDAVAQRHRLPHHTYQTPNSFPSPTAKMPLLAFLVSLCAIVGVALATVAYHYWCRVRPIHIPFWSIELREDSCQYQYLDPSLNSAASTAGPGTSNSEDIHDRSPSAGTLVVV